MAVAQVSLNFLGRTHCAAQALAAASPRILSATPKSVCGSPTAPTPRSFVGLATPKTPARSPFSAAGGNGDGSSSPFFAAGSPVWNDFEMAAKASAEASTQMARLAIPSAAAARQHCLARMARRSSSKTFIDDCTDQKGASSGEPSCSPPTTTIMTKAAAATTTSDGGAASDVGDGPGHIQPRLGLGRRGGFGGQTTWTSGSGEVEAQMPVVLGNTRNKPFEALRELYLKQQPSTDVSDTNSAAALVRENFLRRRAIVARRAAVESGEVEAQMPIVLGNTRNKPVEALRELYLKQQPSADVGDTNSAAALVRENFLRRRAIIASRAAEAATP